jgi:uncharacterized protein YciI
MKHFFTMVLILTTAISCTDKKTVDVQSAQPVQTTDTLLAQKLGADEYGMKKYVMAFLRRGPNRSQDSIQAADLQRAHLNNINRLANEGKLIIAGPFLDDGEIRGIYIFNVTTIEEAEQLTNTDPAIKAGRLVMELHPWYGSAALMKVNEIHQQISKTEI